MMMLRIILSLSLCGACCCDAGAQVPMTGAGLGAPSSSASASYAYDGMTSQTGSSNPTTSSINIGTAASNRTIIVNLVARGAPRTATVTANSVSLSSVLSYADTNSNTQAQWFTGTVSTGSGSQSIVVNYGGTPFAAYDVYAWTAYALTSNTPVATSDYTVGGSSSGTGNISVTAGDFLFCAVASAASTNPLNFSSSTQTPSGTRGEDTASGFSSKTADWTISATSGSFAVAVGATSNIEGGTSCIDLQ